MEGIRYIPASESVVGAQGAVFGNRAQPQRMILARNLPVASSQTELLFLEMFYCYHAF